MKSYAGIILVGSLLIAGCSEKETPTPPPPGTPATAPTVGNQPAVAPVAPPPVAAPAAPATPPPTTGSAPAAAPAAHSGPGLLDNVDKEYVHHLINLNNAYQSFRSVEMRSPRDLNEMVTAKRIDQIPPAPAGKMYKIDEPNLRIILVNQQ